MQKVDFPIDLRYDSYIIKLHLSLLLGYCVSELVCVVFLL